MLRILDFMNSVLLPLKLFIPQPAVARIPFLTTNEDIRVSLALKWIKGYALDIGCGNNRLISEYRAKNGNGLGIDVYDWGSQDLLVKNTAHIPFPEDTFDTVTMIACINHIPNREDVIAEAYRLLKPEGLLIVTNLTPFLSKIWHKLAFWDKDLHERGMQPGEEYGFWKTELEKLFHENGFFIWHRKSFSLGLNTMYICRKNREPY
jgi:SAM-dependent methyltransferase